MLSVVGGACLIAASVGSFWYLLPRKGQEHPLVRNSSVGSSITLVIMIGLTVGVVLLLEGFTG